MRMAPRYFAVAFALLSLSARGVVALESGSDVSSNGVMSSNGMVIDSPYFPAPVLSDNPRLKSRDSDYVQCNWTLGLAYMNATIANIGHLHDVRDSICKSSPKSCTRVAFEDMSGIFFCNDNETPIATKCGNLIDPAKDLSKKCQLQGHYSYGAFVGKVENGTDTNEGSKVSYHLRIAAEGWNW